MMDIADSLHFYVLRIPAGCEESVCRALSHGGWDVRAPREVCQERVRGAWVEFERVLFPCYVFVGIEAMTENVWRDTLAAARGVCSSTRYLGTSAPQPISAQEAAYLGFLAPDANALPPSVVAFDENGWPHVLSGPLLHLEENLLDVDLRQRRARVTLPVLGMQKTIRMAVVPAQPKGDETR